MSRRLLSVLPVVAALAVATPAVADQAKTVTATGTGQVKVDPHNRHSNASIGAAVEAAQQAAVPAAMRQAHEYALRYATAAGLRLGQIVSVSDAQSGPGYYGPGPFFGPFGPNQFCRVIQPRVIKRLGPKQKVKVVTLKRRRVCVVPPFATSTLTITYSAS